MRREGSALAASLVTDRPSRVPAEGLAVQIGDRDVFSPQAALETQHRLTNCLDFVIIQVSLSDSSNRNHRSCFDLRRKAGLADLVDLNLAAQVNLYPLAWAGAVVRMIVGGQTAIVDVVGFAGIVILAEVFEEIFQFGTMSAVASRNFEAIWFRT